MAPRTARIHPPSKGFVAISWLAGLIFLTILSGEFVAGLHAGLIYNTFPLLMVGIQLSLGIATLLLIVPISLASLHQTGALILFTLALTLAHHLRLRRARPGAGVVA